MVPLVLNLTSWHLSISFHRVCQSSVPHSECTFTVIWVNYLYKQAMHLLHLELEISGCTPEVNERFCISACCSWLLSGQVLWCSQKLWCEVALAKPAVLQNCVVAVPEPRGKKIAWNPLGRGCLLGQPWCLVFHAEHPLRAPLAVVGRTPLLAVCAREYSNLQVIALLWTCIWAFFM